MAESGRWQVGAAVRLALQGPPDRVRVTLLAGALLLAASPPGLALSLGPVNVRSAIGQRLVASVPVRLGDGESLVNGCVALQNGPSGLGTLRQASVMTPEAARPGDYMLELATSAPLYEPMYELELRVACPGSPAVVRQYVLMLDLPGSRYAADFTPAPAVPAAAARSEAALPSTTAPRAAGEDNLAPDQSALAQGLRYRVRQGDTLSSIAARVRDRQESLWTLAERIHAANPAAFIRGDANLIRLGAEIIIPGALALDVPAAAASAPQAPDSPAPRELPSLPTAIGELATARQDAAGPPVPAESTLPVATMPAVTGAAAVAPPEQQSATPARPATVKKRVKAATTPPPPTREAADNGPSPLAASIAGIVFGLVVSGLLWLGRNLPTRAPWSNARRSPGTAPAAAPVAEAPRPAPVPIPVPAHRPLPSFTVSYSQVEDDPLAREFAPAAPSASTGKTASVEITSELEKLFGSTGAGGPDPAEEQTLAAEALGAEPFSADELSAAGVDVLLGDDSATMSGPGPAAGKASPDTDPLADSGTIDIHALASSAAGKNTEQARDLMDALTLLERDYEEELTASQVLDLSAMREALAAGGSPTPQLRKKSG